MKLIFKFSWIVFSLGICSLGWANAAPQNGRVLLPPKDPVLNVGEMSVTAFNSFMHDGGTEELLGVMYLSGINEGFQWSNAQLHYKDSPQLYCLPKNLILTSDQLVQILDDYLVENQKLLASIAPDQTKVGFVLLLALQDVFPCP
jgi:hypothetical protein